MHESRLTVLLPVHGDIRHLETTQKPVALLEYVHGDIRHLEKFQMILNTHWNVHGDIRHLENPLLLEIIIRKCSWRHTPFRNEDKPSSHEFTRSWRHTPFRTRLI